MRKLYKRNDDKPGYDKCPKMFPPWLISEEKETHIIGKGFWFDGKNPDGMEIDEQVNKHRHYHLVSDDDEVAKGMLSLPESAGLEEMRKLLGK
jgi:hypothetical protein